MQIKVDQRALNSTTEAASELSVARCWALAGHSMNMRAQLAKCNGNLFVSQKVSSPTVSEGNAALG